MRRPMRGVSPSNGHRSRRRLDLAETAIAYGQLYPDLLRELGLLSLAGTHLPPEKKNQKRRAEISQASPEYLERFLRVRPGGPVL